MSSSNYKLIIEEECAPFAENPSGVVTRQTKKTSFCARVVENADRVSRTGWGVFGLQKTLADFTPNSSSFSSDRVPADVTRKPPFLSV